MNKQKVRQALLKPSNSKSKYYDFQGETKVERRCPSNPHRAFYTKSTFFLTIKGREIFDARWKVFGAPLAMATASFIHSRLKGLTLDTYQAIINVELIAEYFGVTTPEEIEGSIQPVLSSLVSAVASAKSKLDG